MLEVCENFVVLNMVQNVPADNVFKKFTGNTSQRNWSVCPNTLLLLLPRPMLDCHSSTAMLDQLDWPILSKRCKDARLILFYKISSNLAQVPHEHILTKAYEGTRKKNNHKFRHIQ